MENRTYRYFKGQPLYGFGYGLSYTTFAYDQLKVPPTTVAGKKIIVSARVTNTGKRDGEEVIQLYLSQPGTVKAPLKALKGFKRIPLKAGESKIVQFELTPMDLSVVDESGTIKQVPGKLKVSIGGCQPDDKTKAAKKTVEGFITVVK
jgi:beta-glucosidase